MKKILFLFLGIAGSLFSQTLFVPSGTAGIGTSPGNGNVGIGTATPTNWGTGASLEIDAVGGGVAGFKYSGASKGYLLAESDKFSINGRFSTPLGLFTNGTERIRIDANGKVGIGTTSPVFAVDVKNDQDAPTYVATRNSSSGSFSASGFYAINNLNGGVSVSVTSTGANSIGELIRPNYGTLLTDSAIAGLSIGTCGPNAPLVLGTALAERLRITPGGNVGIGTTAPDARLTVDAPDNAGVTVKRDGSPRVYLGDSGSNNGGDLLLYTATGALSTLLRGSAASYFNGGNVGIGTTNPTHPLSVNGTIRAKEVIVDTGWSDYVFADDYRLAPLSEVESHIKAQRHLPGIPSAKEIAEHGVSMGDMQAKLLAKIEELTLHQIAMEKKHDALASRVRELETENQSLRSPLAR